MKGKTIQVRWDNLDDSNNKGSDDNSNNFVAFTTAIGNANFSCESIYKNSNINDETYGLNDNDDVQEANDKLVEVLLILKKQNVKLTKKIKKLIKD